jgi:hypothetical protein
MMPDAEPRETWPSLLAATTFRSSFVPAQFPTA